MSSFSRSSWWARATRAGGVALGVAWVWLAPATAQADVPLQARQHFDAGVALLQDPDGERVEAAYREFKVAYELSGSAKILGNMGYCAMRLERDGEAIDAYSRYLREVSDIEPDERQQIVRDLQTMTVGVSRLTLQLNKPNAQLVDVRVPVRGERITNTYAVHGARTELGIRPGHHILTARLDGHDEITWEFEAYAGAREAHNFTFEERAAPAGIASPTATSSPRLLPWVVTGTGAALLTAGTVTGIIALGKTHDIEQQCPDNICPARGFDLDAKRSAARDFVRATDVLLIAGGIVTAGGLTWLLLGGSKQEGPPTAARARRSPLKVEGAGVAVTPTGGFGTVRVAF